MKIYISQYMTITAALVLLTIIPKSAEAGLDEERRPIKWLIVGMIAAQVADIATTSIALQRGCEETTYYGLQNKWAIGGMKASGTVALTVTLPIFHSRKPNLTRTIAWAEIASGVLGGVLNARQIPRCQ
jgi:hypothetical protein